MKPPRSKILIVDDRVENLVALEAVLGAPDYELIRARSGLDAVRCVDAHDDLAVIVMDLQMPGMDGFEAARKIKCMPHGRSVPIIFVTAVYNEDEDVRRGYACGALDFFPKPLEANLLRTKVRLYSDLRQKTWLVHKYEDLLRDRAGEDLMNASLSPAPPKRK